MSHGPSAQASLPGPPPFSLNTLHFSNFAYSNGGKKNLLVMCATDLNFEWVVDKFNRANVTRTGEEYVQFPCILARNILDC